MKIPGYMAQIGKLLRQILQSIDDQMQRDAILPLQKAGGKEGPGQSADAAIPLPHVRPHDQVRTAGFVFERDERRSLGGSRPLPYKNQAGDSIAPVDCHALEHDSKHHLCGRVKGENSGCPRSDNPWAW